MHILTVRNLICFVAAAAIPILRTYKHDLILPFPVNRECIRSLEMVLHIPIAAEYFYEYLEKLSNDDNAPAFFGLYTDIRAYDRMWKDEDTTRDERLQQAFEIYDNYVKEGAEWELSLPSFVQSDLDEKMARVEDNLDDHLFDTLYSYVLAVLNNHFMQFKRSRLYTLLEEEVQKQEALYDILRSNSMISN